MSASKPVVLALFLASSLSKAQNPAPRADVELPLSTYDQLRASAKERKEPAPRAIPFASARIVKGTMRVDLEKRRAFWDAEIDAEAGGEEPPAVPLLKDASPLARWSIHPEGAKIESKGSGTRLVTEAAGLFHVSLSGEIAGQGEDEVLGIRFPLPRLLAAPSAFDLTLPDGVTLAGEFALAALRAAGKGTTNAGRVTWDRERAAFLVVKRAGRAAEGPPVLTGSLHLVERISDDAVRAELRLLLRVKRGVLSEKTIRVPGFSLVAASGPVIANGPDAEGRLSLRFEPPVRERGEVTVAVTLLRSRDPNETAFEPVFPPFATGAEDRLEKVLTVVAEGGLLVESEREEDWTGRTDLSDVRAGSDDVVLGWRARVEDPKPLRLALRRLKSLAVASALARASITVYVGVSGETRTLLVAEVRSRGRSSLRFRVPADATLLAVRSDGVAAVASRPSPERLEVPIGGDGGRARVEILFGRTGPSPVPGDKLTIPAPAPDEPVERVSWMVVLPPGVTVKEEGRRIPVPPEPQVGVASAPDLSTGERAALEFAERLASADREAGREAAWSPRAVLPPAPLAYATDLVDVGEAVPPLVVTLAAAKEENPWY